MRGTSVVYRDVGETSGICCMHEINKKNKLAALLNSTYKKMGRNVITLYFAVDTRLPMNFSWLLRSGLLI